MTLRTDHIISLREACSRGTMSNTDTTAAGASAAFIAPFIPLRTFVTKRPRTGKALPVQRKFSQARAQLASVSPSLSTADTPVPRDDLKSSSPQKDIHMESLSSLEWQAITKQVMIHVSTKQGRARIAPNGMLYIPSTRKESEALLRQTRELCNLEYTQCKPLSFTGVTDVSTNAIMAEKGRTLDGESIIEVAQLLSAARQTRRMIDSAENVPTLKALVETFRTWPNVEREITKCLDYFGVVQESADPQLRSIRTSLKSTGVEVRQKLNDIMARESDAIQDRVITTRYDRFVIPVKTSHKARFKRGTIHDASSTGNTVYIEPVSVKGLNDRLREQTARERARVNAVLRKLSEELVKPIADDLCHIVDVFAELDATAARSRCSRGFDGVDVEFDDHNPLFLFGVRHPLLSWKAMSDIRVEKANGKDIKESSDFLQAQLPEWKKRVVPSSYKLSKDIRCVCVTGPNTGGKTLSLKTLGVTVLLAKAGFFVPATIPSADGIDGEAQVARIPYFDSVLADIGDDQSLVQSLSTFSGHVRRIKRILTASTSKTLVLLDEIGSGTVRPVQILLFNSIALYQI